MTCRCEGGPLFTCPDCVEYEAERQTRRKAIRISNSGLPSPLQNLSLAEAVPGPALDAASAWAAGGKPGLCLVGPIGVGKTWLAAAAAWHRIQHGRAVRWCSTARLMTGLRTDYGSIFRREAEKIVNDHNALVLDDFDKANPSEFGKEVIFTAIDNRVAAKAPLLITMNSSLKEIGDRYGDPVKSRLKGHCEIVRMNGVDRRLG